MAASKWSRGDLGRFRSEDKKRPRFEVIGGTADRRSVLVWYTGMLEPQAIPAKTFQEDCVNWWTLDEKVLERPDWLRPGATVSFDTMTPLAVRVAEIAAEPTWAGVRSIRHPAQVVMEDLKQDTLTVRSIRVDYASCVRLDGRLILVPLNILTRYGFQRKTVYTHILADEDAFHDPNGPNEEEEILEILKGLK